MRHDGFPGSVALPMELASDRRISPSAKIVYAVLAGFGSESTSTDWPGQRDLARLTGLSTSTVCRALQELEAIGLIERLCGRTRRGDLLTLRKALPQPFPAWMLVDF